MMMNMKVALLGSACVLAMAGSAAAQDYGYYTGTSFEGAYAGGYVGAMTNPGLNTTVGGMGGANFAVTDSVIAGLEMQAGGTFKSTGTEFDALMMGKAGTTLNPDTLVYGTAGGGWINGTGSYAVGAGAEMLATDSLGVRGEVLGTGAWGGGMNNAKATVGVVWHVK